MLTAKRRRCRLVECRRRLKCIERAHGEGLLDLRQMARGWGRKTAFIGNRPRCREVCAGGSSDAGQRERSVVDGRRRDVRENVHVRYPIYNVRHGRGGESLCPKVEQIDLIDSGCVPVSGAVIVSPIAGTF